MSQLNEILATLRKKNNLTQEELGAKLGVSAQSISKWENSVSMPDICLLPMIAETLGVSIDELFGISNSHTINNADDLPKKMHEEIFERINHWFDKADAKEAYKKFAEKHDNVASVFFTKDGAVFENKSIGVIFTKAPTEAIKLINDDGLTEITLSMQTFFFNALIKCDKDKYGEYILDLIEKKYRPMVDMGIGTVWETELGEADFENAGSLCHGWSAVPIYYYHILKK